MQEAIRQIVPFLLLRGGGEVFASGNNDHDTNDLTKSYYDVGYQLSLTILWCAGWLIDLYMLSQQLTRPMLYFIIHHAHDRTTLSGQLEALERRVTDASNDVMILTTCHCHGSKEDLNGWLLR